MTDMEVDTSQGVELEELSSLRARAECLFHPEVRWWEIETFFSTLDACMRSWMIWLRYMILQCFSFNGDMMLVFILSCASEIFRPGHHVGSWHHT